jgi:hypothetical protein
MAERPSIADKPWPERDALARRFANPNRGETQPPVSSIHGAKRDGVPVLRHPPCGFGRGTARRIEKKRDRVAHHQNDGALALWRLGQLIDEETVDLLALNRFFRDANDAGDVVTAFPITLHWRPTPKEPLTSPMAASARASASTGPVSSARPLLAARTGPLAGKATPASTRPFSACRSRLRRCGPLEATMTSHP